MTAAIGLPIAGVCLAICDIALDAGTVNDGGMVTRNRRPRWRGRFDTGPISRQALHAWQTWYLRLDGGLVPFRTRDTSRGLPQAYWTAGAVPDLGGAPWDGSATVTDVGLAGAVTIAGDARDGYCEAVADAEADASGIIAATVRPFPNLLFSAGATAHLVEPEVRMQIVEFAADTGNRPVVRFAGVQVIR